MITLERLKYLAEYDPQTGLFKKRVPSGKHKNKTYYGSLNKVNGYSYVSLDGKLYSAHRLAWFYMTGEWPVMQVDHINGKRSDNTWANLRLATASQNQHNRKAKSSNNTSGMAGVSWHKAKNNWRATIVVAGKSLHLGGFPTKTEAAQAYAEAKATYHPFGVHK